MSYMTYYINTCYVLFQDNQMEFYQNNAIARAPMPGPYYIYNYFLHTHPIFLYNKLFKIW